MTARLNPPPALVDAVRAGLAEARGRIVAAGGDSDRVGIVAVTKGFGPEAVAAAVEAFGAGVCDVGENYAAELVAKHAAVGPASCRWHYLGAVQRNKVARLAPLVDCWQGVARLVEAEAIWRRNPAARLFVEVDTTGQPGRGGCPVAAVPELVTAIAGELGRTVAGLMTVAPEGGGKNARAAFATVAQLGSELGLAELSMGMSGDLEEAVAEGSTMVRLGTALFGPRPPRRGLQE